MPNPRPIGNKTARRGRKLRRDIHIGQHLAGAPQSLRVLTLNARGVRNDPAITEDQIADELIEAAWRAYDQEIEAESDDADGALLLGGPARGLELSEVALAWLDELVECAGQPHTRETMIETLVADAWRKQHGR